MRQTRIKVDAIDHSLDPVLLQFLCSACCSSVNVPIENADFEWVISVLLSISQSISCNSIERKTAMMEKGAFENLHTQVIHYQETQPETGFVKAK